MNVPVMCFQCRQLKTLCSRWQTPPKKQSAQVQCRFPLPLKLHDVMVDCVIVSRQELESR